MDGRYRVILASESPRRREILKQLIPVFDVIASGVPEHPIPGCSPSETARRLAEEKAGAVAARYPAALVIGSDTVVVAGDEILGKPVDRRDAARMLKRLSGRTHQVITGVGVCSPDGNWSLTVETDVTFSELSEEEIAWYVRTGEPMDKAGAYGIQGLGARFIQKIKGNYLNVVGFPLSEVYREFVRRGMHPAGSVLKT